MIINNNNRLSDIIYALEKERRSFENSLHHFSSKRYDERFN